MIKKATIEASAEGLVALIDNQSIQGLFFIFERSLVINCTPHSRNFSAKSADI